MHYLLFGELEEEPAIEHLPSEVFLDGIYRVRLERIGQTDSSTRKARQR
jgi:hypothetical protein